ncbi:MAG TPA: hypothetical protein DCO65_07410, partial [Spartobacteria bacterium]|nr:hypothetical protein [Spartobacteria bacterium]
ALEREMLAVRSVFRRLIAEALPGKRPELIDSGVFANQLDAEKEIAGLGQGPSGAHVSPRTRQAFRKLRPLLLAQLAKTTDPDATLNQFVRFVEAYGLRSLLFELLVTNPKLLELLVKTFDASRFASDLLVRRPQLLEDITRDEKLDRSIGMTGHLEQLRSLGKKENSLDRLRAYRQAQLLRILLRDVLSLADFATVCREQSALAEACLVCVNEIFGGDELTIIAMGKFGGHEITYGADLDVLFVGNESRDAQKLLSVLAQPSAEGNLSRVDARLRPEGEKGPLVCSLETYQRYYAERAHSWELQALTRARPVIGPLQTEFMAIAKNAWDKAGQHVDLYTKIDNMLERIRRERSSGDEFLEFKTGSGGIIEAEFLVQALQMRNAIWEPNWTSAVERLREVGQFTEAETRALKGAYEFLRGCESVLRRYENKSVSALPTDLNEQRKLAKRLGYSDANAFTKEYVDVRETMHALYQRHIKKTLASS